MKIEFHYTYLFVALSFIITGYFSNLIVFTSIIIIHELGHYIIAKINNLEPQKIIIYPFGGITKLNNLINTKVNKELMVAISGIIFQTIYYLIIILLHKYGIIREYIFNEFKDYHYSILFFNILPIYPLDGSKIINLLLTKILPYKQVLKSDIVISIITILIIFITNYYHFNYTVVLIMLIILTSIIKYYKNINYLFNRFLLERYLYKFNYPKIKKITKISNMYKEKRHIIRYKNHFMTEKAYLKVKFDIKS